METQQGSGAEEENGTNGRVHWTHTNAGYYGNAFRRKDLLHFACHGPVQLVDLLQGSGLFSVVIVSAWKPLLVSPPPLPQPFGPPNTHLALSPVPIHARERG